MTRQHRAQATATTMSFADKHDGHSIHTSYRHIMFAALTMAFLMAFLSGLAVAYAYPRPALKKQASHAVGFDRMVSAAIGVQGGYFQAGSSQQSNTDNRATYGLHLHIRLIKIFGFSAAYDFSEAHPIMGEVEMPYSTLRLTGHLYLANIGPIHINLLGGVGLNFSDDNGGHLMAAYIIGAEVGFRISPRFVINAGFRFALPSLEQVVRHYEAKVTQMANSPTATQNELSIDTASVLKKIFDFRNFNVGLNARFFL